MENDKAYFRRRAADEWLAVNAAGCDQARVAHATLATRYAELAKEPSNVLNFASAKNAEADSGIHQFAAEVAPIAPVRSEWSVS